MHKAPLTITKIIVAVRVEDSARATRHDLHMRNMRENLFSPKWDVV